MSAHVRLRITLPPHRARIARSTIARSGLGLVVALGACGGSDRTSPAPPGALPEFATTALPDVSIGVVEGASEYELFDVDGAIRLSDGRIVVANAGSRELRYFDPAGRFLARAGGNGGGPGEFRYLRRIFRFGSDSVLAVDWDANRLSIFDAQGQFVHTTTPGTVDAAGQPLDVWLAGAFWVLPSPARAPRARLEQLLRRLPPPDGAVSFRFVFPADDGGVWIRDTTADADGSMGWTVLDEEGTPSALVRLPPRFDLYEVGPDFVLGRWRDVNDVNFVYLYHLERTGTALAPSWLSAAPSAVPAAMGDTVAIGRALRSMVTWQEAYYPDHNGYAEDADSLAMDRPEGIELQVLAAGRTGWIAVGMQHGVPPVCGIAIGSFTPIRWIEAGVTCGAPPTPRR